MIPFYRHTFWVLRIEIDSTLFPKILVWYRTTRMNHTLNRSHHINFILIDNPNPIIKRHNMIQPLRTRGIPNDFPRHDLTSEKIPNPHPKNKSSQKTTYNPEKNQHHLSPQTNNFHAYHIIKRCTNSMSTITSTYQTHNKKIRRGKM